MDVPGFMTVGLKIFVVDTGPLITLAAAGSLDYLLYVEGAEIVIPDAVLYEATHDASRLGAVDILAWAQANRDRVEFAPTQAYRLFDAARIADPGVRQPNLGEQAAVEVIEQPGRLEADEHGVLLCEESAVLRRVIVRDRERIVEISTTDFLRILEQEGRIQSVDAVLEMALAAGRKPGAKAHLESKSPEIRDAIHALVRRPDSGIT